LQREVELEGKPQWRKFGELLEVFDARFAGLKVFVSIDLKFDDFFG
jgi:hypothetical protein